MSKNANGDSSRYGIGGHQGLTRRQLLLGLGTATIGVGAGRSALASAIQPALNPPAPQSSTDALFRIEKVSDVVYAAIGRPAAMLNCNAAVLVNSDHVIVVDTHSKPSAAQALINQIRKEITDKPVRYVVNSHFHWDHAQGNLAYPQAYGSGVDVVSSTTTREWLAREGVPRLRQSLGALPGRIKELRGQISSAKTDLERNLISTQIEELESYLKEMTPPEKQIVLPTITFDDRLVIHQGGREIHLLYFGRGHTAGDVVVYIPAERAVATGDLLHGILPYMGDGYPDEWPSTLTALEKVPFERVVPGHGSVQRDRTVVAFFRNYIGELNEAVARGVERGAGLKELKESLSPSRIKSINSGGHLERIGREMSAFLGPAGDMTAALRNGVGANVADVYNYYAKRRTG